MPAFLIPLGGAVLRGGLWAAGLWGVTKGIERASGTTQDEAPSGGAGSGDSEGVTLRLSNIVLAGALIGAAVWGAKKVL